MCVCEYTLHTQTSVYPHICAQTYIYTLVPTCPCTPPDLPGILPFCKIHRRKWKGASGNNGSAARLAGRHSTLPHSNHRTPHPPGRVVWSTPPALKQHISKDTKVYPCRCACRVSGMWVSVSSALAAPKWFPALKLKGSQSSLNSLIYHMRWTAGITAFLKAPANALPERHHGGRKQWHQPAAQLLLLGGMTAQVAASHSGGNRHTVLPRALCVLQTCLPCNFFKRMVLLISGAFELLKGCVTFN